MDNIYNRYNKCYTITKNRIKEIERGRDKNGNIDNNITCSNYNYKYYFR